MNDELNTVSGILEALMATPGAFGDGLRAADARKRAFIAEHGEEAYDKHMEELKNKEIEEVDRKRIETASKLRLEKSGLANVLDDMTFEKFKADEEFQRIMLAKCKRFVGQDVSKWLYVSGQPGCGKTHLGTAVCSNFLSKGQPTRYMTHRELINAMIASQNDYDYYDIVREYGTVAVLYIDDFFKPVKNDRGETQRPTAAEIKHTFEVLNLRLVRNAVTIITSERSLLEICNIDEALGSRIKQRCGEFTMDILRKPGRNYRMRDIEQI